MLTEYLSTHTHTAANLLIDYNCQRLKVADFGCAELLEECQLGLSFSSNDRAGTLAYNPPEVRTSVRLVEGKIAENDNEWE